MVMLLRRASRATLDLLYPPRCALCGRAGAALCSPCAGGLAPAAGRRCDRCWRPSSRPRCHDCAADPPAFAAVRAPFVMAGAARRLVHELKYDGLSALGAPMGALMAAAIDAPGVELVVPVPLHRGRLRARGYNQAGELGRHLAEALALPYDGAAARRVRATAPLARSQRRDERRRIVAGAFAAPAGRVRGRRILLVDDVVTTGATLDACARALLAAGAVEVRGAAFARAD